MYVGTQFRARHETDIRQLAQLGVEHVDVTPDEPWTEWTVDLLASIREKYAKYGITVESIHSPPSSRDAFNSGMPHIFLGPSDERERELDGFCEINSLGPGWHESAGIFGCPVGGSVADGAVRPGVEWLAAGPRRG